MDKEQARFILRSFRPDGADSHDDDFAEALKLAAEDRELGQWLASERAFDATFTTALSAVELPADLRQCILAGLAIERGDIPQAADPLDAAIIGALASLQPPPALRLEILAAMDRTSSASLVPAPFWRRAAIPLAAAAGIALAFFATRRDAPLVVEIQKSRLPIEVVEAGFIREYESPGFKLEEKREDHGELLKLLKERKLPCPCCLPRGFAKIKGIGCRQLIINGKCGSLICFKLGENDVVHLIIFRREDVAGDLPQREAPTLTQHGRWTVASWGDGERAFVLLGDKTDPARLSSLF